MRACLLLGLASVALVVAGPAAGAHRIVERGVVQSVTEHQLVLRALDGSVLTVPVDGSTRVRVNGRPGDLDEIEPGFVAAALLSRSSTEAAVWVRAVGRSTTRVERGRLVAVGRAAVVLKRRGRTLRIPLDDATVVRRHGLAASRHELRRGMRVTVRLSVDGSAARIVIRNGQG